MTKHRQYDIVYVMDFKLNDEICNVSGYYIRDINNGISKGQSLLQINGAFVTIDQKKVLTPKQFSDEMNIRNKTKLGE
jgi:hypothetical protein